MLSSLPPADHVFFRGASERFTIRIPASLAWGGVTFPDQLGESGDALGLGRGEASSPPGIGGEIVALSRGQPVSWENGMGCDHPG